MLRRKRTGRHTNGPTGDSGVYREQDRGNGFAPTRRASTVTRSDTDRLLRIDETGSWGVRYWLGLLCSAGIVAINLVVWTRTGAPQFLAIAGSFLLGIGLFLSRFWNPILYLVGVAHVLALGVVWVLGGRQFLALGAANGALALALVAVALSLFVAENRADAD